MQILALQWILEILLFLRPLLMNSIVPSLMAYLELMPRNVHLIVLFFLFLCRLVPSLLPEKK